MEFQSEINLLTEIFEIKIDSEQTLLLRKIQFLNCLPYLNMAAEKLQNIT
jgi:hypothetical protein